MRGILIVNGFLRTGKFEELYALLEDSARAQDVTLSLLTSDRVLGELSADSSAWQAGKKPDFCLFWDKDIYLAQRLESLGLRLFNGARAVEMCDNKLLTALALSKAGVATPKTFFAPKTFAGVGYSDLTFLSEAERALGYPMIVKEACGSFGQQVYLVRDRAEAEKLIAGFDGKEFLMQEFISESCGKDLRVNVVGGRAVCAMERYNERDFRSNITGGGHAKKHLLTQAEEELAVRACEAVGADFAGVDILLGKDGPLVCEVNSNPHFKSTLDCTGVDLSREILRYIRERL